MTAILVVSGIVLGFIAFAAVMEIVMTVVMLYDTFLWLQRWFGPADPQGIPNRAWVNCLLHFESSMAGRNSGVGGNIRFIDVTATEHGLILRVPMYAPATFFRLWRWSFAEKLFPPCLIPYEAVTHLVDGRCQIHVKDPMWPTMFVSADSDTLRVVAEKTGLVETTTYRYGSHRRSLS